MKNYDLKKYERPSVATDTVVFSIKNFKGKTYRNDTTKKLMVLLIKRKEEPFINKFALPGGFLRPNETVEEASLRELIEETGVSTSLTHLGIYSEIGRDPRGWIISSSSLALIPECTLSSSLNSDAEDATWFEFDYSVNKTEEKIKLSSEKNILTITIKDNKVISSNIAFDHGKIIYDAYKKLQELILTKNFLFSLLPTEFKISEAQTIYEIVVNKKEAAPNFRRKIQKYIKETGHFTTDEGHRPSQLYSYDMK